MIELIVKSYFSILFAIGTSCFAVFTLGLYLILKLNKRGKTLEHKEPMLTNEVLSESPIAADDISAIAGEDLVATQLDLAKAFIESGKHSFAKKILETIVEDGNPGQQEQARLLLGKI